MEPEKKTEEKVEIPPQKKEENANPQAPQNKKERTRLEKLRHTEASIRAQIAEEEASNGGIIVDDEDDNKPITRGDLKRIQREDAKKTALTLANDIEDEDERSEVIELLETRILPSGNPQKDMRFALNAVRSEKNQQIVEEIARKKAISTTRSSGTGSPRREETEFIPTETELAAAAMVGKKDPVAIKAFILKARAKEQK